MSAAQESSNGGNLSHREIQVIFFGLMAGMLVAALDQTVVSTALPTIVGDLGGLTSVSDTGPQGSGGKAPPSVVGY